METKMTHNKDSTTHWEAEFEKGWLNTSDGTKVDKIRMNFVKSFISTLISKTRAECTLHNPPFPVEYSKIDHGHCFQKSNPPCGQKIKHFECCLCKEPHPEIANIRAECIEEVRGIIGGMKKEISKVGLDDGDYYDENEGYNSALSDLLNKIKESLK